MCQGKPDYLIVYSEGKSTVRKRREKKKQTLSSRLGAADEKKGGRRGGQEEKEKHHMVAGLHVAGGPYARYIGDNLG